MTAHKLIDLPGVGEDGFITLFRPEYVDLMGGDHLAALMLAQIVYWYLPGSGGKPKIKKYRDGYWWLAKSHIDWHTELRLTRAQTARCLQRLKERGVIATEKYLFDGHPTIHLRCTLIKGNVLPIADLGAFHCRLLSIPLHENQQCITETTTETTAETENLGASTTEDKTMTDKPTGKGKVPNSSAAILKQLKESKGTLPKPTKITVTSLIDVWRKVVPAHNPGVHFVGEFTLVQKGQFSNLIKRWGGAENLAAAEYLAFVLERWTKYTKYVESVSGAKNTPALPTIAFLLKYCEEARNMFLDGHKAPTLPEKKPMLKPVPKPSMQEQEPDEEPMTLEELLAMSPKYEKSPKG